MAKFNIENESTSDIDIAEITDAMDEIDLGKERKFLETEENFALISKEIEILKNLIVKAPSLSGKFNRIIKHFEQNDATAKKKAKRTVTDNGNGFFTKRYSFSDNMKKLYHMSKKEIPENATINITEARKELREYLEADKEGSRTITKEIAQIIGVNMEGVVQKKLTKTEYRKEENTFAKVLIGWVGMKK